ncbi:hypothetical protein FSW04_12675 [Baekduia soli]|uniref:Uncharacterized protein n=1 Tax=Baekduia soli TaxID=496014 RepID=A0A5B8U5S4_9ACTN|nr:hypothetical protein [Baekduia soli]QEC48337.1 hypothetical protein FSW04_12675 [Baekduia soli]
MATLAVAAPAGAQAVATATPPKAGGATKLHYAIDGTLDPVTLRIPTALTFSAPTGFTFDTRALAARCSRERAVLNECPKGSAMGGGQLVIGVTLPDGSERDAVFALHPYMSTGNRVWMLAYVTGWRVVPGTLVKSAAGLSLVFDPLPVPPPFPNVGYAFKSITLDVGATRTVKKVVKLKARARSKKARKRTTKTRYDLIHAPAQCAGSWAATVDLTFPDGSALPLPAPMPCTP